MAQQKSIIKLSGTIGDLTFYQSQDGHLVKSKSSIPASKIANDPNFARTRENGSEFGSSAQAGKLLRDAVRTLMMSSADNRATSRVTQVMTVIKNYDTTSVRGQRNVGLGIATPDGKAALKGFNFNINSVLAATLYKPYAVNTTTGVISIASLIPNVDVAFPSGATHLTLKGAWAKIDFTGNTTDVEFTNLLNVPIDGTSTAVTLTPTAVPTGTGISLFFLAIDFFQEVNGIQYTLKNGAYNSLAIIEVV